jgi:hypothetical protein
MTFADIPAGLSVFIDANMQHHGLVSLASDDGDFDRVPGLARYAPA